MILSTGFPARVLRALLALAVILVVAACDRGRREEPPPRIEFREPPRASVRGSITVPPGVEALGVHVFAEGTGFSAFTDSGGNFTVSQLPAGAYRLQAMRPDLETALVAEITVAEADLRAPQPYQTLPPVAMRRRGGPELTNAGAATPAQEVATLRGEIRTELPADAPGTLVRLVERNLRAVTDSAGRYQIANVPLGTHTLEVAREGFRTVSLPIEITGAGVKNVDPIMFERLRTGDAPRTVFGTVRKEGPAPLDGITALSDVSVFLEGTNYAARPDVQGRFQINDVRPGVYTVSATAPGWVAQERFQVDLFEISGAEIEMVLVAEQDPEEAPAILGGRVLFDDTDAPAAGVTVSLIGTNRVTTTNREGIFVLDEVPPGVHDLRVEIAGYLPVLLENIEVLGADNLSLGDIYLEPDVERPEVVFADPRNGSRNVAVEDPTFVTIQFSLPMNEASVRAALRVDPPVDFRVAFEGAAQPETRRRGSGSDTVVLELRGWARPGQGNALRFRTRYTVTVAGTAASVEGVEMGNDFSLTFTTGAARIVGSFPEDGQVNILPTSNLPVRIFFNAPINRDTLKPTDIQITPRPFEVPTLWFRDDPETGWTEAYVQIDWEPDTRYRIRISGRPSTILRDRIENVPYTFEFRTPRRLSADDALDLNENEENRRRQERIRRR